LKCHKNNDSHSLGSLTKGIEGDWECSEDGNEREKGGEKKR